MAVEQSHASIWEDVTVYQTQGFNPVLLVPPSEDIHLPRVTSPQRELSLLINTFICITCLGGRWCGGAGAPSGNRSAALTWGAKRASPVSAAWSKSRSMWLMTIKRKCSVAEMFQIVALPRGCWLRDRVAGASRCSADCSVSPDQAALLTLQDRCLLCPLRWTRTTGLH